MGTLGWMWGQQDGHGDIGTDIGTLRRMGGQWGGYRDTAGQIWGHWDGCGDIRMDVGSVGRMWAWQEGHGDIGVDIGASGWMWDIGVGIGTLQDRHGDTEMDEGHWDGCGDIRMDVRTLGRM